MQQTALAAAISSTGATSITVDDFLGFPSAGAFSILIDSEVLRVTAGNGTTTWTVTRGYGGTTAATHLDNSTVSHLPTGSPINLGMSKTYLGISDTDDDAWLPYGVGAVNRAFVRAIGVDLSPSADTARTYDADSAVRDGSRLWVPGGIRAFTAVEVSSDASTWTAVTSDVRIGPATQDRPPGEPGSYVEFKPYVSGSLGTFWGYAYVRITGTAGATFGWDDWPDDAVQACLAALQRLHADRGGRGSYPTETDAARYLNPATIAYYRGMYFPLVR